MSEKGHKGKLLMSYIYAVMVLTGDDDQVLFLPHQV